MEIYEYKNYVTTSYQSPDLTEKHEAKHTLQRKKENLIDFLIPGIYSGNVQERDYFC